MESGSLVNSLVDRASRKEAEVCELRETLGSVRAELEAERAAFCSREEKWARRCEQIRAQARQEKAACDVRLRDAADELRKALDRLDATKLELLEAKNLLLASDSRARGYAERAANDRQKTEAKNNELSRLNGSLNAEITFLKAQLQSERDDRARWARSRIDLLSKMAPRQDDEEQHFGGASIYPWDIHYSDIRHTTPPSYLY